MHRVWRWSWFVLAACGGGNESSPPAPLPVVAMAVDATTRTPPEPEAPMGRSLQGAKRAGRPIEIILRSTPSGAKVAVDGVELGVTPAIWLGETGAPHELTFVLAGHKVARYRFVPIASGLVHPRLEPMVDNRDAPRPPPQMIAPVPAPPSTVVEPDAAVPPPAQ
jgi:hypothetical protein